MNAPAYFEIQVDDTARAINFYKSVFGWEFVRADNIAFPYWRVITPGTHGGLFQRPAQTPPPECGTNAFCISMEVENFDVIEKVVLDHGGKVALPKFAIPGLCWQGYFLDTEHNVFGCFESNKDAK